MKKKRKTLSDGIHILLLCVAERQKGLWRWTWVAIGKKQAKVWEGDQVIWQQDITALCNATGI